MVERNVRLACIDCDRNDKDDITRAELLAAIRAGWKHVRRVQTYEQATVDNGDSSWWTHLGWCPECAAAAEARGAPV